MPTKTKPKISASKRKVVKRKSTSTTFSQKPASKKLIAKQPRRRKAPVYRSFRLHKRIRPAQPKLPNAFRLFATTLGILRKNWRLFTVLAIIYGLLTVLLVRGVGGGLNLQELKSTFADVFKGRFGGIVTGAVLFSTLLGSAGSTGTQDGSAYQSILMLIISLTIIWALRQVQAGHKIRARDAFYKGTYPLVQFTLVLMVVGLQLLPFAIGSWLYSTVVGNGIASTLVERGLWMLVFGLLMLLSFYMICSSVFALFIVTLPDMTPFKALRSARQLVLHRRWSTMRKVLFLPLALVLLAGVIMLPLLVFVTQIAEAVFFMLTMVGWLVAVSYLYNLYRELLRE